MKPPGSHVDDPERQRVPDASEPRGRRHDRDQHEAGGDRRALEVLDLLPAARQRLGRDVVARETADAARREVDQDHDVPEALHAGAVGDGGRGHAERDDVGQRVELASQGRVHVPRARHPAVEHVERQRHRNERGRRQQAADVAQLEVRHDGEDREHAARGVAEGQEIREMKAADHREMAPGRRRAHAICTLRISRR